MPKEFAAGGVVFRTTPGEIQLLMITDRFGRLTLPKGKLEPGEGSREAALREIREETGIEGMIIADLITTNYSYLHPLKGQVDKQVDYYLVRALNELIIPQVEEILDGTWLPLMEALQRCGYENNRPVLVRARQELKPAYPTIL